MTQIGIFSSDKKDKQCSMTNRFLLNEIEISFGNENNTHFFVTYETESRALTTSVQRFKKRPGR